MSDASTRLIRPPALKPGDRVHVVSPSGPVVPEILRQGLELLRSWDLDVVVDDAVFARRKPYDYLAGSDKTRHDAFMAAWNDPKCRAIICSRGGYGAMRLLPHLDVEYMTAHPRLLVGFSDITALHLYIAGIGGLATLHGPVLKSVPLHDDDEYRSIEALRQALFATTPAPEPWTDLRTVHPGTCSGPVFGGNLSLIVPLLASPYAPSLDGAIVVVEEVGEQDYRLDRLLTALRLADDADIAGLVLGDFSECSGVYVKDGDFQAFVEHLARDFDCPVVTNAPVGHESRNIPFPVGVQAHLDADAGTLRFDSHATYRPDST